MYFTVCFSIRMQLLLAAHRFRPPEKMAWIRHVFSKKILVVQPRPLHRPAPLLSSPKRWQWYSCLSAMQKNTVNNWIYCLYILWFVSFWQRDKAGTPGLKSSTPTPRGDSTPGPSSTPGVRPSLSKPPSMEIPHPPSRSCTNICFNQSWINSNVLILSEENENMQDFTLLKWIKGISLISL